MKRLLIALAVGAIAATATQALAVDEPENVVKYRKAVMKAIGGHTGQIAGVVKGEVSFVKQVGGNAHAINELSKVITSVFPKGTSKDAGFETRALPKIWQDWAGFEAAAKKLGEESAKLAKVAEGGDVAAIGAQFENVGKACGGCHKPYREEKKK